MPYPANTFQTVLDSLDVAGDCWLFTGGRNSNGYGRISYRRRPNRLVHRVVYSELVGPIPDGLTLDHMCKVRHCANPDHLDPVDAGINALRGEGPPAKNARRNACANGHDFTPENTRPRRDGGRACRACHRTWQQEYRERKEQSCRS